MLILRDCGNMDPVFLDHPTIIYIYNHDFIIIRIK